MQKKYFVIVDEAFGEGAGDVDLHFQLAPGKAVFDNAQAAVRTDFADGWNVLVQAMEQKGMALEEEEGQVSFVYTRKEPRPAFRYRLRKEAKENGVRFVTVLAPYTGVPPKIKARILGQPKPGASRVELQVQSGWSSKRIRYNLEQ